MFKRYGSIVWLSLKVGIYIIIPLTTFGYVIEMLFDIVAGHSIAPYFTLSFLHYFIFHELMLILYSTVFTFTLIGTYLYTIKIKPKLKPR
ncbi:hypothetical protein [Algibacillus agarilyticus]|uniref:hypothetical protein n=1 Tax=Algibacillus agarilyticus TaxID=2234133 RepID=UPI000DD00553|nr:hypothetical protein [Algibacillus agarilyticus]